MDQLIFCATFLVAGLAFIWLCRRMERNRRLEIYKQMLRYIEYGDPTGFCGVYKSITKDIMFTDITVFKELLNESKKQHGCRIKSSYNIHNHYWFSISDITSRRIVLQNLINKLQKQKI